MTDPLVVSPHIRPMSCRARLVQNSRAALSPDYRIANYQELFNG